MYSDEHAVAPMTCVLSKCQLLLSTFPGWVLGIQRQIIASLRRRRAQEEVILKHNRRQSAHTLGRRYLYSHFMKGKLRFMEMKGLAQGHT